MNHKNNWTESTSPVCRVAFIGFLALIVILGVALRLTDFDNPPLDFHPARQLHSALIARGFYLNDGGDLPEFDAEYEHEALSRGVQELWIEPPVMEWLSARLYHAVGDADLRVPRALAVFFWLLGAAPLAWLTWRRFGAVGFAASLSFYLLFPYGVVASRSFQPEPLLICLMLFALDGLDRWSETERWRDALYGAIFAGLAIFVKQVAVFPLGVAMVCLVLTKTGSLRKALISAQVWTMALVSIAPVLAYNVWGVWIDGFLRQQYQGRFVFSEWTSVGFYIRWLRMIDAVFSIWLVTGALFGVGLISDKKLRWLTGGFFVGYIVYGFALPHHIGTHDYYQLPLFPWMAIGLASLADVIFRRMGTIKAAPALTRAIVLGTCLFACGWMALDASIRIGRVDYRDWPERYREFAAVYDPYAGQINTIGIMDDYGAGMIYWGLRTPMIWDRSVESLPENEANDVIAAAMRNRQYLIVTDLTRFYRQPRLQRWLMTHGETVDQQADYLIIRILNGDDAPEEQL